MSLCACLFGVLMLHVSFEEFIHFISSEANEICEQESKKTIAPEHTIGALKVQCGCGSNRSWDDD